MGIVFAFFLFFSLFICLHVDEEFMKNPRKPTKKHTRITAEMKATKQQKWCGKMAGPGPTPNDGISVFTFFYVTIVHSDI